MADLDPTQQPLPQASAGVPVVNPHGEPETVDQSELPQALKIGYRLPSQQELASHAEQVKYGEGLGNDLEAGAAGAARAASFGLSDKLLTGTGAVDPETLKGLARQNPVATGVGEAGGVLGALMLPGAGEIAAGRAAAEAGYGAAEIAAAKGLAAETLGAGDLLNPVQAIAKVGSKITKAAEPLTEKIVGTVINPQSGKLADVASRVLSGAGAGAAGSAVEGAAYGLGQAVSENALGDPDALGEKLYAHVGHGAVLGAELGSLFHGITGLVKSDAEQAVERIGAKAPGEVPGMAGAAAPDNFADAIKASGLPEAEKTGILSGIGKLKPNVGDLDGASERLGVPAFPAQRSDSELLQNRYGMATQSPDPFGVAERQRIQGALEKVQTQVDSTLGPQAAMSEAELGQATLGGIKQKLEQELDPLSAGFEGNRDYLQAVPVSENATRQIGSNILKIDELVNSEGKPLSESSEAYRLAQKVVGDLPNLKTVDDIARYRTLIRNETKGVPGLRNVAGRIQEKLGDLEERSFQRFADTMKTPDAKEKVLQALEERKALKAKYAEFGDKMGEIADIAGKRKVYGPKDLIGYLEDSITPEKFASRLVKLAKTNSGSLDFLRREFPDQFNLVRNFVKSDIRGEAMKGGALDIGAALKAVNKLSPEAREMFFHPKDLQILKDAKTWKESWPQKWGPSGTPQGIQYIDFFKNPASAIGMSARSFAGLKFANHFAGSGDAPFKIAGLARLERTAQDSSNAIRRGASALFGQAEHAIAAYSGLSESKSDASRSKKAREDLRALASDPEKLVDHLEQATRPVYAIAPNTAGGIQATGARAVQFLASKIPVMPDPKPFSRKLEPSPAELAKFSRFQDTVENPLKVFAHINAGTLLPDHMETLQTVFPKLLQEMQRTVLDQMTTAMGKPDATLPYQKKLMLSLFLGQDLDQSIDQQTLAANQLALAQAGQNAGDGAPGGAGGVRPSQKGLSSLSGSNRLLTSMQDTAQRERG